MTIDEQGWLPPEQSRGAEARSMIPEEFHAIAVGTIAPPSLAMPLAIMIDKSSAKVFDLLQETQNRWNSYFSYLETNLENPGLPCTFQYKKRTPNLNTQSALDDYPRGLIINDGYEIHIDLQSQMIEFA